MYSTKYRLSINYEKTFFILTSNKTFSTLRFDGHELELKTQGKFLGIILDDKLKFNHHIHHISNKISKSIGIIHRLRNLLPKRCLYLLYHSFILPYLSYCNIIWGGTYETHLQPLFILQKRAIRLINKQPYLAHTEPLFQSSNILTLRDLHKYLVSIHMYKNKNSMDCFRSHHHSTRHRHHLLSSFHRLTTTQHSISHAGPTIWNTLPDHVTNSNSLNIFKYKLKHHLISLYNSNNS